MRSDLFTLSCSALIPLVLCGHNRKGKHMKTMVLSEGKIHYLNLRYSTHFLTKKANLLYL